MRRGEKEEILLFLCDGGGGWDVKRLLRWCFALPYLVAAFVKSRCFTMVMATLKLILWLYSYFKACFTARQGIASVFKARIVASSWANRQLQQCPMYASSMSCVTFTCIVYFPKLLLMTHHSRPNPSTPTHTLQLIRGVPHLNDWFVNMRETGFLVPGSPDCTLPVHHETRNTGFIWEYCN